jgi:BirA family biotin operon repressor/biotin-[acetyl-CoA-carboxylase] ligase
MDQHRLEQALSDLSLGPIHYYTRIGSTNDEAASWADRGAPDLALVIADEQTAGQGRHNRRWITPPDSALAFSLILMNPGNEIQYGDLTIPQKLTRLTALGAVAVCQTLRSDFNLESVIKWPNDVLIDGRKLCGTMAKNLWNGDRLSAVLLGIGINATPQSIPTEDDLVMPATSVETELGTSISRLDLLHAVLEQILHWLPRRDTLEFVKTWNNMLAYRDKWVQIITYADRKAGNAQEGKVVGITAAGWLELIDGDGNAFFLKSGEISLRPLPD